MPCLNSPFLGDTPDWDDEPVPFCEHTVRLDPLVVLAAEVQQIAGSVNPRRPRPAHPSREAMMELLTSGATVHIFAESS